MGNKCYFGGSQGCTDSISPGGCDVDAGTGRKRTTGQGNSWRFRETGGGEVWGSGQDLHQQPCGIAFKGDEYALRRFEAKLNDCNSTQLGHRYHAAWQHGWVNSTDYGNWTG